MNQEERRARKTNQQRIYREHMKRKAVDYDGVVKAVATRRTRKVNAVDTRRIRHLERNVANILVCAATARPLSVAEICTITGLAEATVYDHAITCWLMVPWLTIAQTSSPEKTRLYSFLIDEELRNICEAKVPRPDLGDKSIHEYLVDLRQEIDHRRKEAKARRFDIQWKPTAVIKHELIELLNDIELKLDSLTQLNPHPKKPIHPHVAPKETTYDHPEVCNGSSPHAGIGA